MSRYYIYDSYTNKYAEFAEKKKDNRRRNAMIGAGSVAGLGAIRYGGAAAKTALAQRRMYNGVGGKGLKGQKMSVNTAKDAMSGGARGQLGRDLKAVKYVLPGLDKSIVGNLKRGAGLLGLGAAGYGGYRYLTRNKRKNQKPLTRKEILLNRVRSMRDSGQERVVGYAKQGRDYAKNQYSKVASRFQKNKQSA